ncbi:MAG TPA: tRNA lysidine(34) synthetase TilS [Firmicutes bacterium]|nr:tRNA lysidine(34) synthetase TilS [Bacillota bacterium]
MTVDLLNEFVANVKARQLLDPKDHLLVAVSSGPDSMALLHLLWRAQLAPLGVFHLNHRLRPEAEEEADFVAAYTQQLDLPVHKYHYDVNRYAAENRVSVETAAREVRYRLLEECMEKHGYTKIALGHHQDDQAETVLLHLIRGSGLSGLAGMKPKRDCYIRPLLPFTKAQLIAYCRAFAIKFYHDRTNFSPEFERNKLRLELIPLIEREYNPKFSHHLAQLAEIVRADDEELTGKVEQLLPELTCTNYGVLHLQRGKFRQLSLAFQRRVLQSLIAKARQSVHWAAFEQVESLRELILNNDYFTYELPLLTVIGEPNNIVFGKPELPQWEPGILPVPGTVSMGNCQIRTEVLTKGPGYCLEGPGEDFALDQLCLPLVYRRRKPGDAMQVFGQTGKKKIKDLLIEAKIPRYLRDHIPIICDQEEIIWVCGVRRSEKGRVTPDSKEVIRIILEDVRGLPS